VTQAGSRIFIKAKDYASLMAEISLPGTGQGSFGQGLEEVQAMGSGVF
jgi:hypothetical protein